MNNERVNALEYLRAAHLSSLQVYFSSSSRSTSQFSFLIYSMRRLALIAASYYEQGKSEKWPSRFSLVRLSRVFLKMHYSALPRSPLTLRSAGIQKR